MSGFVGVALCLAALPTQCRIWSERPAHFSEAINRLKHLGGLVVRGLRDANWIKEICFRPGSPGACLLRRKGSCWGKSLCLPPIDSHPAAGYALGNGSDLLCFLPPGHEHPVSSRLEA